MANTYKVLGQAAPAATTTTNLYTVPSAKSAVISTMSVVNRGASTESFRMAIRPAGATLDNQHWVIYDSSIAANDTLFLSIGATMAATDVLEVYNSLGNLSYSLFGTEMDI